MAEVQGNADRRPTLTRSALGTYAAQIGISVLSLVNVFIVARTLGAAGRGEVAFLVAVAYITSQFASLGIQFAHSNLAASRPELRPTLATNAALFAALLGGAAAFLLVAVFRLVPDIGADINFWLLVITAGVVPCLVLWNYLFLFVQAEYRFLVSNIAWITPPIVNAVLNAAFAGFHVLTPARAFGTWVIGQLISLLVLVYAVRRREGFGRPDRALAKSSLAFGAQAHFGRVMLLGNYRVDQWILGAVAGSRELGIYSVAVSWAEVLFFVPTVLSIVQRPDFARAERAEVASSAATGSRAALLLTTPLAALLFLAAPFLCEDVFGAEFADSAGQLRILVLGAFGICLLKILGASLTAQRRPNLETLAIGGAFVVTIGLDALLIPGHGGTGASIASTCAYTVGGVLVVGIFSRTFGVSPRRLLPRRSDPRWILGLVLATLRRA